MDHGSMARDWITQYVGHGSLGHAGWHGRPWITARWLEWISGMAWHGWHGRCHAGTPSLRDQQPAGSICNTMHHAISWTTRFGFARQKRPTRPHYSGPCAAPSIDPGWSRTKVAPSSCNLPRAHEKFSWFLRWQIKSSDAEASAPQVRRSVFASRGSRHDDGFTRSTSGIGVIWEDANGNFCA